MTNPVAAYWRCSPPERRLARQAIAIAEPQESDRVNRAALGWVDSSIAAGALVAGVVVGFAITWALSGSVRSVPLFILAVVDSVLVANFVRLRKRFRRRMAAQAALATAAGERRPGAER